MTKDDLEKVQKRVSDLLYDIELQPIWEDMHAAMNENKAEEKPVEKPVPILQKKRHLDIFIDEKEKEKFWEVKSKKMRLAEMAVMKKEYGPHDSDATASEDEEHDVFVDHRSDIHTFSVLKEIIKEFCEDERFGINDALLAQETDSEADDANENEEEEGFDEEEVGSDEEEDGSDEEKEEYDDSDSE
ncbi:glutamic acid-rich protein-like [Papaver somniferum]|uniref:glutamic acid-rich protein-like n=1 Tax=Papaver somniferum TaxID=3469 RepID=UPI000E701A78|nr:glutamic acid-rich protein-like [Papaver somniferum]